MSVIFQKDEYKHASATLETPFSWLTVSYPTPYQNYIKLTLDVKSMNCLIYMIFVYVHSMLLELF